MEPKLKQSLQIGAHQVDQVFGQLGCDLFFRPIGEMKPDMIFEHFSHQTVDTAANGSLKHQLVSAVLIGRQRAFNGVQLSAQFAQALHHLDFFPLMVGHRRSPCDKSRIRFGCC